MKKILFVTVFLLAAAAHAADGGPSPLTPLAWLAGGTWRAALPPGQNGVTTRIELVVTRPENGAGLKFESAFVTDGQRRPYTCGMYAWDAARKKFVIFYTDASGSLSLGDVSAEGDVLAHEFTATHPDGTVEPVKVVMTRLGQNTFTNDISVRKDSAWMHIVTVKYERAE